MHLTLEVKSTRALALRTLRLSSLLQTLILNKFQYFPQNFRWTSIIVIFEEKNSLLKDDDAPKSIS